MNRILELSQVHKSQFTLEQMCKAIRECGSSDWVSQSSG